MHQREGSNPVGRAILIIGLVVFFGTHVLVSLRRARGAVIKRVGEGPYKGLFSAASLIGLVLIVYGFGLYRREELIPVWSPPAFLRHLAVGLMWPAFVAVVGAYLPGNIKKLLKHPMLVGVKLWALAHLLANGDLGGMILFGSILGWAVYDRISLKSRTDPGAPDIPLGGGTNDAIAIVVGTLIYLAVGFVFHPLAGVPVFTG